MSHLRVVSDPEALAHAAAQEFLLLGAQAIRARGRFPGTSL